MPVPKYDGLFEPLLQAMQQLGGSASITEQEDAIASNLRLTEKEVAEIHRGTRTKLSSVSGGSFVSKSLVAQATEGSMGRV